MFAFDFRPRTRVVFASGAVHRAGELAHDLGFRRTLVVADAGVRESGYVAAVTHALEVAGTQTFVFSDFGANPDSAMVAAGAQFARPLHVDSIVGLGGGSSLDAAKGVNFLLTNGGSMADYRGYGKVSTPLLPMIGIPTTAGTGSEAQSYAVISDPDTHTKMACGDPSAAFRIAILDPDLTATAPRHVTAMAGFDAIAHAVEAAVTTRRTPLSDLYAQHAWKLLNDAYPRVLVEGADANARAMMMLGAHFAGTAIEQSMLGAAHACANPLTARYGLTHGLALAILLPHVVRWNGSVAHERYGALIEARGPDASETLVRRLEELRAAGDLPTSLGENGVDPGALPDLAREAAAQWTGTFNPRPFDESGALEIYRAAM